MMARLLAVAAAIMILATACTVEMDQVAQARFDDEAAQKAADEDRRQAEALLEEQRLKDEAELQEQFVMMAGFLTARVNELSLIDLDQDCVATGLRDAGIPLVSDPGRPLSERDANQVSLVMVDCGALDSYMRNLNQLGVGPNLTDQERGCLRDFVGELAGSDFQQLIAAELTGEAGVVRSATFFDNVYSTTWDGIDNCSIDY